MKIGNNLGTLGQVYHINWVRKIQKNNGYSPSRPCCTLSEIKY